MPLSFTHLWQQQEHSDIDLILATAEQQSTAQGGPGSLRLCSFAAHNAILSNSSYIAALVSRWQRKRPADTQDEPAAAAAAAGASNAASSSAGQSSRPQIVLTLQDASEQAAALAVLSSLYAVKPLPELLSELTQEQQLQAALLADMWQVPDVSAAAVSLLAAAQKRGALSDAVLQHFAQLQAVPAFLLPLLSPVVTACLQHSNAAMKAAAKPLLLLVLGDLEEVLADAALKKTLLGLSLPAMELLLSLDSFKVASEDTVLSAVRSYVTSARSSARQAARAALGPLIRCQHLSVYWLSACALCGVGPGSLLIPFSKHLKKLLMARLADPSFRPTNAHMENGMEGAPISWLLDQRTQRVVSSVEVAWVLSVKEIRDYARRSAEEGIMVVASSTRVSAPLGGMTWGLMLEAKPDENGNVVVGIFCQPRNAPADVWYKFQGVFEIGGHPELEPKAHKWTARTAITDKEGWGFTDFFETEPMAGGWDEAAWAAAGLPSEGELTITMRVTATHNTPGACFSSDSESGSESESESPE